MKKLLMLSLVVVICFSMVACDKEEKPENTEPNTTNTETRNNTGSDKHIESTLSEINKGGESRQAGNRYIKKLSDTVYGVYYVEDDEVVGYELYSKFADAETAGQAKAEYPDVNQTVDYIDVVNDTMVVVFKPIEFEGTTVEDIEEYMK